MPSPDAPTGVGIVAGALLRMRQIAQDRLRIESFWSTLPTLSFGDYAGMLLGVLLIFAVALINGHGRIFWEDETLGWVLLRDPSWSHMVRAWQLGADGGGIFFYILGRVWFHLFGDGILAFRLFTATSFGLALSILWLSLKRFYTTGIIAFAIYNTLFFSPPLTMHYMEGRFYGLLMLGTALAFFLTLVLDTRTAPLTRRWYVCVFAAHLLLTGSHVLGVLYSAFLVLAMIVLDLLRKRRRPLLYLAASSSWLLLLIEKTALESTARVGRPHFWTTAPSLGQVLGAWSAFSPEIFIVLLLLFLTNAAMLPAIPQQILSKVHANVQARLPVYVTAGCLMLVPAALLLEGLRGTWLFTDRYLQPVALGVACLTAELCWGVTERLRKDGLSRRPTLTKLAMGSFVLLFAAALLSWVFGYKSQYTPSVPDFTADLNHHVPEGLPVVVEDALTFTELMSRPAGGQRPYTFLLNWNFALSPGAQRAEVTQYHLMQNWKSAGYFAANIQEESTFLRDHDRFFVVSNTPLAGDVLRRPQTGNPVAQRLSHATGYCVRPIFSLDRTYKDAQRNTVWFVSRGACEQVSSLRSY